MKKLRSFLLTFIRSILTIISPKLNTKIMYFRIHKKRLNLKRPTTFHEKLSYLKLYVYNNDPLVKQCSDKIKVRDYIENCNLGHTLNNVIGIFDDVTDIKWDIIPSKFVLKWNFGSTFNIICKDKSKLDIPKVEKQLKKWKKSRYHLIAAEFNDKNNEKKLLCENHLDDAFSDNLIDYKAYCFNGEPRAILVIADREEDKKAVFMDLNWNVLGTSKNYKNEIFYPEKPENLEEFIEASRILSKPFDFVRVDFYFTTEGWKFGELTFTPGGSVATSTIEIDGKDMGEFIELSNFK